MNCQLGEYPHFRNLFLATKSGSLNTLSPPGEPPSLSLCLCPPLPGGHLPAGAVIMSSVAAKCFRFYISARCNATRRDTIRFSSVQFGSAWFDSVRVQQEQQTNSFCGLKSVSINCVWIEDVVVVVVVAVNRDCSRGNIASAEIATNWS